MARVNLNVKGTDTSPTKVDLSLPRIKEQLKEAPPQPFPASISRRENSFDNKGTILLSKLIDEVQVEVERDVDLVEDETYLSPAKHL